MKKYIIIATLDDRTCPICIEKNGTYTDRDDIVPFHPNCRCILVKTDEELSIDDYLIAAKTIYKEKRRDKELYNNFISSIDKKTEDKVDKLYKIYLEKKYLNINDIKENKLSDTDLKILKMLPTIKIKNKKWALLFLILYFYNEKNEKNM